MESSFGDMLVIPKARNFNASKQKYYVIFAHVINIIKEKKSLPSLINTFLTIFSLCLDDFERKGTMTRTYNGFISKSANFRIIGWLVR